MTAIFKPVVDQDIVLPTALLTQSEDVPRKEEEVLLPPPSKASAGHGQAAGQASNKTLDFHQQNQRPMSPSLLTEGLDANKPSLSPAKTSVLEVGFSKGKDAIKHRSKAPVQRNMEHLEALTRGEQPRSKTSVLGVGFTKEDDAINHRSEMSVKQHGSKTSDLQHRQASDRDGYHHRRSGY
jgi:hypothetical protein